MVYTLVETKKHHRILQSIENSMEYFCDLKRHLICTPYTVENLHLMAEELGIKKCWFHNGHSPHYDIPKRRIDEIMKKCTILSEREILKIVNNALLV